MSFPSSSVFVRVPSVARNLAAIISATFLLAVVVPHAYPSDIGSRLAYLDEDNPYYVNGDFPKLTTPMWIGEEGVEAAILLSIDDMCRPFPQGRPKGLPVYARQPKVYFNFLKPVIERLRKIDGRAPISVFCLQLDEADAIVREMLQLGLSMECHTFTHPVPLMRPAAGGKDSLALAKEDFLKSVGSLHNVEGSTPVAHRTPGCDARNTASPRFFTEVFPLRTTGGGFLRMDSSIFMAYTKPVKGLPREWFFHEDGRPRFAKFIGGIPFTKTFVNYVENYPYPYVINNLLWELPAAIPGDAHGVHAYKHRSPKTVEDLKRAIDIMVAKQGLFTLCFHPHGYIDADQVVELIDYVDVTYGKRIKFLNCREINERLTKNALGGVPLRADDGSDNGVRVLDVNNDGFLDVAVANGKTSRTRVWDAGSRRFRESGFPVSDVRGDVRFFTAAGGAAGIAWQSGGGVQAWVWNAGEWKELKSRLRFGLGHGTRFLDVNGDGVSDLIVNNAGANAVYLWSERHRDWRKAGFALPARGMLVDRQFQDRGLRFVDVNKDGHNDLVYSNEDEYGVWQYVDAKTGWSKKLLGGRMNPSAPLVPITVNGRNNGVWFRPGEMLMVNEFTAMERDHVVVRRFSSWLKSK